jgi:enoyl-CoA hydratase
VTDVVLEAGVRPGIALVTFDGPAKLNTFSRATWIQLGTIIEAIVNDASLDVAVLTGRGRAFVAGADIDEYVEATQESFVDFQRLVRRVTDRLTACPKPLLAAVNGFALGGGFELMMACDLVLASTAARFGLPEVTLGLLPGGGGTQRLPRAVGGVRAKELLMTGRIFDAAEAQALGLVNRVVTPEELLPASFELAEAVRRMAPLAVRMAKTLVDRGTDLSLSEALNLEADEMPNLFPTADAREGIAAFKEKRAPRFTGK